MRNARLIVALFTVLAVIPISANVYASSGEDHIVPITGRQVDIGGPSGSSVTVDIGSNLTLRTSNNLSARRTSLTASNSSASSGSLTARAQYRTGTITFTWHNDVTRTIPRGNGATGNSHLFNNTQTWRLQLARANNNQSVTGTGRLKILKYVKPYYQPSIKLW